MISGLSPISSSWRQSLETHDQRFSFQLNLCGNSPYVTSSLTRGWVCRLQLLLGLASAVILVSESRGTHDHILLSQIRDSWFYDSQGYGGYIRTSFGAGRIENTASNNSSIVACWFVAAETCLLRHCLEKSASVRSSIPAFSRHTST
jgi:hypothetical protein